MSRRQPTWKRPDEVALDLMCRCGRRLDRAVLHGESQSGLEMHVRFVYDDVDRPGRGKGRTSGRIKGRPAADTAERMLASHQQGDGPFVRTLLCKSCGARPEVSVQMIVNSLTGAYTAGQRGNLGRVVVA